MSSWWSTRGFDPVEVSLVSLLVGLIAFSIPKPQAESDEVAALERSYGPARFSAFAEEWIIRDFFHDRRDGVFVDVGAAHYQFSSNTYYLEHALGWSGLAIEPLRHFEADYARYRPRTRFRRFFASDVSDEQITMYTFGGFFAASSSDKSWVERFGVRPQAVTVPTITLNDLLAREQMQAFDFLSMDIELAEPKALAGFDIDHFQPALVCIEAHPAVRQQILDYFAHHRYVVVGKYLRTDELNLYFTPLRP